MAWIVSDADHLGGKPRVRDTRIAVALLFEWLAAGMTIGLNWSWQLAFT
jgi:uncharacterized protein (DUF433 family)